MSFLKKYWKYILIFFVVCAIVLGIGHFSGVNSALFNMVLDELRDDKSTIVEVQAENMKWYEATIKELNDRLAAVDERLTDANRRIDEKETEIEKLRKERSGVTTSSEPSAIVDDLHKLGYGSERRRSK